MTSINIVLCVYHNIILRTLVNKQQNHLLLIFIVLYYMYDPCSMLCPSTHPQIFPRCSRLSYPKWNCNRPNNYFGHYKPHSTWPPELNLWPCTGHVLWFHSDDQTRAGLRDYSCMAVYTSTVCLAHIFTVKYTTVNINFELLSQMSPQSEPNIWIWWMPHWLSFMKLYVTLYTCVYFSLQWQRKSSECNISFYASM